MGSLSHFCELRGPSKPRTLYALLQLQFTSEKLSVIKEI